MLVKAGRGAVSCPKQQRAVVAASSSMAENLLFGRAAFCFLVCPTALSAQLPAEALEAVKAAAATTAEQKVQRYHAHTREAQQQLLDRVLLRQDQQQQQQQAPSHAGGSPSTATALLSGSSSAAAGAGEARGPSAAELTMQQLVALLAQRDVRVDDTPAPPDAQRCGSWQSCAIRQHTHTASPLPCLWCV